nr:hypothetical protein Iba_chr14cCG4730 [Ipomoea batatas]GMD89783.1 hypothetical protein Iba_chr14dCG3360 [Ipomoea batatas]
MAIFSFFPFSIYPKTLLEWNASCRVWGHYYHTLLEGNSYADYLANLGQEGDWSTTILPNPPDCVKVLLHLDSVEIARQRVT